MGSINWAFLCDYAFQTDGKGSLIGIFDAVSVKTIPFAINQLFVVASMDIFPSDGTTNIAVQISSPSGNVLGAVSQPPITAYGGIAKHNLAAGFYGVPIEEPGEYHIEIFINGQSVHLIPLPVKLVR